MKKKIYQAPVTDIIGAVPEECLAGGSQENGAKAFESDANNYGNFDDEDNLGKSSSSLWDEE